MVVEYGAIVCINRALAVRLRRVAQTPPHSFAITSTIAGWPLPPQHSDALPLVLDSALASVHIAMHAPVLHAQSTRTQVNRRSR